MRKWATNSPVSAGVALVVAGFIALFLAWNGAAGVDHVEGQLPYLISGGLSGLGLIGSGLTVINVQARRGDQADLLAALSQLTEAVEELDDDEDDEIEDVTPIRRGRGRLKATS